LNCTMLLDMVCRLLSNVCVATSFYQRPASRVYFYALFNLRNLLYLIKIGRGDTNKNYTPAVTVPSCNYFSLWPFKNIQKADVSNCPTLFPSFHAQDTADIEKSVNIFMQKKRPGKRFQPSARPWCVRRN